MTPAFDKGTCIDVRADAGWRMRLFTKGLLLVAVPVVCELALLVALFGVERQVADAERWALQSKKVINQAEALLGPLLRQASQLRTGIIVGDPSFADKRATWVELADRLNALEATVADNPEQTGRIARMRETIDRYRKLTQRVAEQLREGERQRVIEAYRGEEMPREINEFRSELGDFVDAENKLQADRNAQLQGSLKTQQFMLWFAVSVSLLIAVITALAFARHIGQRIEVLTMNALRLGTGEPLGAPLGGCDEIAQLDEVLHDTSRKLVRAEREHALLKADLQRRTGELAQVNEELRQQTQDNEMFIYSVSHDLRSPLVNLQGFSRELKVSASELRETIGELDLPVAERERLQRIVDGEIQESIGFLQSAVTRAGGIIEALLRLSRAGRVEYQWALVDMSAVLQRIIGALKGQTAANGARVLVQPLPPAWGDAGAIEQIFGQLVGNAFAYLDPSRCGVIEVGWINPGGDGDLPQAAAPTAHVVQPGPNGRIATVRLAGTGERHRVYYVRDNGRGIPAASLPKVFSAFQRLHTDAGPGDGIGLALVKRMVERHRGRVWVESAEGAGSTFYVALPAHAPLGMAYPGGVAIGRAPEVKNQDSGKRLPYWAQREAGMAALHVLTAHRVEDAGFGPYAGAYNTSWEKS
ncbi:Sensory transduction protein kinase (EC 2.7.3.-) [Mycetohabitans rhizoxinica HKI 454]|uniref:histidine kinase n=2 Tax=Mycetohabitans rhizoxinica TaxID=412963 RepID=E5ART3_MYCRK|nr:Sensory transduction protein kinase (EC 2.7.3.-) [Mycetohabitans rhizoxinica HKI 454]